MHRNSEEQAVHGSRTTFMNDRYVWISPAKQPKTQANDIQLSPAKTKKITSLVREGILHQATKEIALLFRFHATAQIRRKRLIFSLLHALPFMPAVRSLYTWLFWKLKRDLANFDWNFYLFIPFNLLDDSVHACVHVQKLNQKTSWLVDLPHTC